MPLTVKIWCDDEPEPDGLFNRSTCQEAPPNWFREEPSVAAELYALERDVGNRRVNVIDDAGRRYVFSTKVRWALEVKVTCIDS